MCILYNKLALYIVTMDAFRFLDDYPAVDNQSLLSDDTRHVKSPKQDHLSGSTKFKCMHGKRIVYARQFDMHFGKTLRVSSTVSTTKKL